jgi:hypothetical protein
MKSGTFADVFKLTSFLTVAFRRLASSMQGAPDAPSLVVLPGAQP